MAGSGSSEVRTPIFSGENYEFWKIKMVTIFKSYGLWSLVEKGFSISDSKKKESENISDEEVDEKTVVTLMKDAKAYKRRTLHKCCSVWNYEYGWRAVGFRHQLHVLGLIDSQPKARSLALSYG